MPVTQAEIGRCAAPAVRGRLVARAVIVCDVPIWEVTRKGIACHDEGRLEDEQQEEQGSVGSEEENRREFHADVIKT